MIDSLFHQGQLHLPYFIFVRCGASRTDMELLNQFGLSTYRPARSVNRLGRYAIFADDGEWTMIADDWGYTLWHMPATRETIRELGRTFDVFACSVGDCDESFDFVYYRGGQLLRRYIVTSPHFSDRIVTENIGPPLPGETAELLLAPDALHLVLGVARSVGIRTDYGAGDVRVYAPPAPDHSHTPS